MEKWDGKVGWKSGMEKWDGKVGWKSGMEKWDGKVGWKSVIENNCCSIREPQAQRAFEGSK